jgi:molecular chaperone GrpE
MTDTPRPDTPETPAETAPETAATETMDALAQAQAEAAGLKDKLLRTLADMENLRRRTEREVADARSYGISSFARDLLAVADNMRRALETVGDAQRDNAGQGNADRGNADQAIKAFIEGVELTERELNKALEKNGVRRIEPQGEKFDPNLHQAMYEMPDASVPAGCVAQVMQPGYLIGERVLRPALVGVSKGGAKPAPKTETKSASDPADADGTDKPQ